VSTDPLRHDWSVQARIETRWETDIGVSLLEDAESRRQVYSVPLRTQNANLKCLDQQLTSRLAMTLYRRTTQKVVVPIYPDVTGVTSDSTGTVINCDTTNRRFFVGRKIVVIPFNGGTFGEALVHEVVSFTATTITITVALTATVPARSFVFPAMEAHQELEADLSLLTNFVGTYETRSTETHPALPESNGPTNPSGFPVHLGLPIFTFPHNWVSNYGMTYLRTGDLVPSGKDRLTAIGGGKGRWSLSFAMTFLKDRAGVFSLMKFFDSRRGRLLPFWAIAPMPVFEFLSLGSTFVDILGNFDFADTDCLAHIAVVLKNGDIEVRRITNKVQLGGFPPFPLFFRFLVTPAFPPVGNSDVDYVTLAIKGRFTEDVFEERWTTNQDCDVSLSVIELISEETVTPPFPTEIPYIPPEPFSACPLPAP